MSNNLKILSYNINKGKGWNHRSEKLEGIKQVIKDTEVEIAFLQEVVGENLPRKILKPQYEMLADQVWHEYAYGQNSIYENGHHGNALLSKFPIKNWWQKDISTNRFEQRGILYAKVEIPGSQRFIHLYCLHLDLLYRGRGKQITTIISEIKNHNSAEPLILAGDLNDWNFKVGKTISDELGLKECAMQFQGSYLKTFPSFFPILSLDRIYTRGFNVKSVEVLKGGVFSIASDHLPIKCELEFE